MSGKKFRDSISSDQAFIPSGGIQFHCFNEDLILEKNLSGWHPELLENYNGELQRNCSKNPVPV